MRYLGGARSFQEETAHFRVESIVSQPVHPDAVVTDLALSRVGGCPIEAVRRLVELRQQHVGRPLAAWWAGT